jgi:hypothetical protein
MVQAAMARNGLKPLTKAKQRRLAEAAEQEAVEAVALEVERVRANETSVQPDQLTGVMGARNGWVAAASARMCIALKSDSSVDLHTHLHHAHSCRPSTCHAPHCSQLLITCASHLHADADDPTQLPNDHAGRKKRARDKAGRIASVLEGREGREEFGSRSSRKKQKTGSKSEREKQRAKQMPIAARIHQLRNRATQAKQRRNPKHFKGHIRGK